MPTISNFSMLNDYTWFITIMNQFNWVELSNTKHDSYM